MSPLLPPFSRSTTGRGNVKFIHMEKRGNHMSEMPESQLPVSMLVVRARAPPPLEVPPLILHPKPVRLNL